ncbi:MAG: hypothetical protein ACRCYU_10745 [Nocardioides sp.]
MTTQVLSAPGRPVVGVDELKRAWRAVSAGEFRPTPAGGRDRPDSGPRPPAPSALAGQGVWSLAVGEHTVAVVGCAGSVGASTLALAAGLAATSSVVRVVECCSATSSGLAAASTTELGLHGSGWRQGRRDQVLIERTSGVYATPAAVPVPAPSAVASGDRLTVLDIGWDAGAVLATDGWLAEAVRTADRLVLVATATFPGVRRLAVALDLLAPSRDPDQVVVAMRGPRRRRWPRGLEHAGGPVVRTALAAGHCVEIPEDRDLAVNGLDSRPVPGPLVAAAQHLLLPVTPTPVPGDPADGG